MSFHDVAFTDDGPTRLPPDVAADAPREPPKPGEVEVYAVEYRLLAGQRRQKGNRALPAVRKPAAICAPPADAKPMDRRTMLQYSVGSQSGSSPGRFGNFGNPTSERNPSTVAVRPSLRFGPTVAVPAAWELVTSHRIRPS